MQTHFTPGPWHAPSAGVYAGAIMVASCGSRETMKSLRAAGADPGQVCANALLIAAAPDLLQSLRDLVEWAQQSGQTHSKPAGVYPFVTDPVEYSVYTQARQAIAKAIGE